MTFMPVLKISSIYQSNKEETKMSYENGLAFYVFDFLNEELNHFEGNYLEIGVFDGKLIQSLAKNHPNKTMVGIDPFIEDGWTTWLTNTPKGGELENQKNNTLSGNEEYKNIIFYQMTSEEFFNQLSDEQIEKFGIRIVFIDGDHSYESATLDYKLALRLIGNNKGIIIFDDMNIEDVKKAQNEFAELTKDIITGKKYIIDNAIVYYIN